VAYGRSRRSLRWAAWILLATACSEPARTPAVDAVYVLRLDTSGSSGFEGRGQAAWLHDVIARGLSDARWFRSEGEGTELSGRLVYEIQTIEDEIPVLRVQLAVQSDAALAAEFDALGMELEAYVELERKDRTIEIRRDLPYAVQRAIALVDAKVTVVRGEPEQLAALTTDADREVVAVALSGIRRRRLVDLGDAVFALLDSDDESIAMGAIECLGVIGSPRHAPGLLRAVHLADRAHADRLYDALANLGGEHARGFLAFAVRNEEDPELALMAEQALDRLDRLDRLDTHPTHVDHAVARGHRQ